MSPISGISLLCDLRNDDASFILSFTIHRMGQQNLPRQDVVKVEMRQSWGKYYAKWLPIGFSNSNLSQVWTASLDLLPFPSDSFSDKRGGEEGENFSFCSAFLFGSHSQIIYPGSGSGSIPRVSLLCPSLSLPFQLSALPAHCWPSHPTRLQGGRGRREGVGGRGLRLKMNSILLSQPSRRTRCPQLCTGHWGLSMVGGGGRRRETWHSHSDGGLAHLLRQNKKRSRAEQSQLGSKSYR